MISTTASCPFSDVSQKSPTNQDWWPNELNLLALHENSASSCPYGEGFDYAAHFLTLDLKAVMLDLHFLLTESKDWWPADFGNYGLWADGVSDLQYTATLTKYDPYTGNMSITGLPEYPPGSGVHKRPYVGQVITISKYLTDLGYTATEFYSLSSIEVTYGGSGYTQPPKVYILSPSKDTGGVKAQAVAVISGGVVVAINLLVTGTMFTDLQLQDPAFITIDPPVSGTTATAKAVADIIYYDILTATDPISTTSTITVDQRLSFTPDNPLSPHGASQISFYQVSRIISSSHCLEYVGSGTDIGKCIPARGGVPDQTKEVIMTLGGRVAYTSTDHLGNFRIGPELVINQNTGTLSGRTFNKSLFAIMTPYILAIE